jgi:hypothetical protein
VARRQPRALAHLDHVGLDVRGGVHAPILRAPMSKVVQ